MDKIILAQLIAHIIADFFAQPECFSERKQTFFMKSPHIYTHTLIVFVVSIGLTFTGEFVPYAAVIAAAHFGIDALKCVIEKHIKKVKKISAETFYSDPVLFFADQILHLAVIYVTVLLYWKDGGTIPECAGLFTTRQLLLAAGFLICLKPANVLTRICMSTLKKNQAIGDNLKDEGLQKAGRWIGSIERIMAFVMVIIGQYVAIGFIIAAKSILRYNDTNKAEYVLIGTLMSFGIAFILGIGITSGIFEFIIDIISCN